jgi:hypothetical protein
MGERILIEMTGILHQNTWCLFAEVRGSGSCVYDIKEAPGVRVIPELASFSSGKNQIQ